MEESGAEMRVEGREEDRFDHDVGDRHIRVREDGSTVLVISQMTDLSIRESWRRRPPSFSTNYSMQSRSVKVIHHYNIAPEYRASLVSLLTFEMDNPAGLDTFI